MYGLSCKNNRKCYRYWCNIVLPTVHGARQQNLALNKPAWTATNQTLNPPGIAVDGDTSTLMETTSPWPFLAIDLQGWYKLERTWFNQLTGEWQWIYDGYCNCCLKNYKTHIYVIPYMPTRIYKRARAAKKSILFPIASTSESGVMYITDHISKFAYSPNNCSKP